MQYTKDELENLMKVRLEELLKLVGGYVHLAKMIEVSSSTTQGWVSRGRISKSGAKLVGSNTRLFGAFKAEYLRPDLEGKQK